MKRKVTISHKNTILQKNFAPLTRLEARQWRKLDRGLLQAARFKCEPQKD